MRPTLPNLGKTVGITAHPDDLFFNCGGSLLYQWQEFGLAGESVCATLGTASSTHLEVDAEKLGLKRKEEDRRALARIGVTKVRYLGWQDGDLNQLNFSIAVRRIVNILQETQPDTVPTFNPYDGLTGHSDHKAIGRITTMAFRLAKRHGLIAATTRLIYISPTPKYMQKVVPRLRQARAIYHLPRIRFPRLFIDHQLEPEALSIKWDGVMDYESQIELLRHDDDGLEWLRPWMEQEGFILTSF